MHRMEITAGVDSVSARCKRKASLGPKVGEEGRARIGSHLELNSCRLRLLKGTPKGTTTAFMLAGSAVDFMFPCFRV